MWRGESLTNQIIYRAGQTKKIYFSDNRLTSLVIPEGITSIGDYAFFGKQLASVVIPEGVTSIGAGAFYNNRLTSVVIPDSVTSIGAGAFRDNRLTSVRLPRHLRTMIPLPHPVFDAGVQIFGTQSKQKWRKIVLDAARELSKEEPVVRLGLHLMRHSRDIRESKRVGMVATRRTYFLFDMSEFDMGGEPGSQGMVAALPCGWGMAGNVGEDRVSFHRRCFMNGLLQMLHHPEHLPSNREHVKGWLLSKLHDYLVEYNRVYPPNGQHVGTHMPHVTIFQLFGGGAPVHDLLDGIELCFTIGHDFLDRDQEDREMERKLLILIFNIFIIVQLMIDITTEEVSMPENKLQVIKEVTHFRAAAGTGYTDLHCIRSRSRGGFLRNMFRVFELQRQYDYQLPDNRFYIKYHEDIHKRRSSAKLKTLVEYWQLKTEITRNEARYAPGEPGYMEAQTEFKDPTSAKEWGEYS